MSKRRGMYFASQPYVHMHAEHMFYTRTDTHTRMCYSLGWVRGWQAIVIVALPAKEKNIN